MQDIDIVNQYMDSVLITENDKQFNAARRYQIYQIVWSSNKQNETASSIFSSEGIDKIRLDKTRWGMAYLKYYITRVSDM